MLQFSADDDADDNGGAAAAGRCQGKREGFIEDCESVGVKMSLMNRLRNMRLKREDSRDGEKDADLIALSAQRRTAVLLFLGWFVITWCGFHIGKKDAAVTTNAMFSNRLLSEYNPPSRRYNSLYQSRELSIPKGGENATYLRDLWSHPDSLGWKPCVKPQKIPKASTNNGYYQVFCSGGLFQLHICVVNAVAVAKLLNATLVLPYFTDSGVWNDPSKFHDIYDIDHFIFSLKNYLPLVRDLPVDLAWSTPEYYDRCEERPTCIVYIPKHSNEEWYMRNVLPVLQSHGIVATRRYHHKLTFDHLPEEVVKIRCHTNFFALRFVPSLFELSESLVERLRAKAKTIGFKEAVSNSLAVESSQNSEKTLNDEGSRQLLAYEGSLGTPLLSPERFIGLHLRFEKDMIAHSACYYGGGVAERRALAAYRRFLFQNRAQKAAFPSAYLRMNGSCPLSPEEAALLLAGLGYDNNSVLYVAGQVIYPMQGANLWKCAVCYTAPVVCSWLEIFAKNVKNVSSVYGGEARIKPLRDLFPYLENKETIATEEELRPLKRHGLQLAALDFLVLMKSDVYMSTSAGNFPNVLTGYRTFFGGKKSIHPDKAVLVRLLTANSSGGWDEFSEQVRSAHSGRLGAPKMRPPKYSVFRYPIPDCMCHDDGD